MTIHEAFPVGTFTAQVYHEGKPAEIIEITIQEDGLVIIDGPQWYSEGLLFKDGGCSVYEYVGIAQLKLYEGKIAAHKGYMIKPYIDTCEFRVTAFFQGGSITSELTWQII
jgi:hypothetical protein